MQIGEHHGFDKFMDWVFFLATAVLIGVMAFSIRSITLTLHQF